ncbi:peroxiredoxin [Wolbachia endosymbiont of Howardula sp.]|uniref:peroxiredoxin n=1 Tax=Wolbachia endosymbiont of Howardula sp. TaxID=2916816 RepID=UPI00217D9539|nr:peroxiredoxin [Wolbachia endosymbiont of Howardula sp.]UWI83257.1 peroxiredoxin [Wolbachia endosymbiont of Howardula sp.]
MNLVTKSAIDFLAPAVLPDGKIIENFCLREYIKDKYAILLFYPLNFTFVCPTELIALNNRISEFAQRDVEVIGISVDSQFSHLKWQETPVNEGGIGKISYSLISDITKSISRNYGVLYNDAIALRATFIIDTKFMIRHQSINDLPIGRNIDEMIRLIDALIFHTQYGEVCPAGWNRGQPAIQPSNAGISDYLNSHCEEL